MEGATRKGTNSQPSPLIRSQASNPWGSPRPKNECNFLRSRAYCFVDAKRNMAKEPQPREGETRQMEGLGVERAIESAGGDDAEARGEIYRRYVRRVFGLCRYILTSREGAE